MRDAADVLWGMNHAIVPEGEHWVCMRCRLIMAQQADFETILCKPLGMTEVERDFPTSRR